MKKFLFSLEYYEAEVIGFDLDGTLYDEFEFINQVYSRIIDKCNLDKKIKDEVLVYMLEKWLEKGSSYPFIFLETKEKFNLGSDFENTSLNIFRNFNPKLKLSSRLGFVLNKMKNDDKKLFLLTDGRELLQNKKIDCLNIRDYFDLIIIAQKNQKPSPYYGDVIKNYFKEYKKYIYIGDRERDKQFSKNSKFIYINVVNLF